MYILAYIALFVTYIIILIKYRLYISLYCIQSANIVIVIIIYLYFCQGIFYYS